MTTVVNLWLKIFVFTFILVWFLGIPQVGASPDFTGNWCKKFDDFTSVMLIQGSGDLEVFSVGNDAHEKMQSMYGYISRGASSCHVQVGEADYGVVDCKVRKVLGTKTLILSYSNGSEERFKKCSSGQLEMFQ